MNKSEHDALIRMSEFHRISAEEYAEKSKEAGDEISAGYLHLSSVHKSLAQALRKKARTAQRDTEKEINVT